MKSRMLNIPDEILIKLLKLDVIWISNACANAVLKQAWYVDVVDHIIIFHMCKNGYRSGFSEATTKGVLWKKIILNNLQNWQENTSVGISFFNKAADLRPLNLVK